MIASPGQEAIVANARNLTTKETKINYYE